MTTQFAYQLFHSEQVLVNWYQKFLITNHNAPLHEREKNVGVAFSLSIPAYMYKYHFKRQVYCNTFSEMIFFKRYMFVYLYIHKIFALSFIFSWLISAGAIKIYNISKKGNVYQQRIRYLYYSGSHENVKRGKVPC